MDETANRDQLAHVGFCAILGLPNVGKSTLLNRLLGVDLMAVSPKPQTTRNRVIGVVNRDVDGPSQVIFVDTPGVQKGRIPLRRYMRDEALAAAGDADVALVLIDVTSREQTDPDSLWKASDGALAEAIELLDVPLILGLNKVDRLADKSVLLPMLERFDHSGRFAALVPMSAKKGQGVDALLGEVARRLPPGPVLFPEEMVTDRAEQFLAAELVREQLYLQLGQEVPYATAVQVDSFEERTDRGDVAISATIHVEKESQKGIVIGSGGRRIKSVGENARQAISRLLGCPVHLVLFVRVTSDWSHKARSLREFGYD